MVALALALSRPEQVGGLVLASGYYYPTARADVALVSPPATPVLGDILCYSLAPLIGEVLAPRYIKKIFWPLPVPVRFKERFPVGLMLRPSQISAASKDGTHMIPDAHRMAERFNLLSCPVAILAGSGDQIVEQDKHATLLHKEVAGSTLDVFKGTGHMLHYADPIRVVQAIELVSGARS